MRKIAALCGAVLLTVALATPAAANEVLYTEHEYWPADEWYPVSMADGWEFECDGPLYYANASVWDLQLWYRNGETDPTPDGVAWPWVKGKYTQSGVDYFNSKPTMQGAVSGKFKWTGVLKNHDPGPPETWRENLSGRTWGITIPGFGPVFQETGNFKQTTTVVDGIHEYTPDHDWWTGLTRFEVEKLCAHFGY